MKLYGVGSALFRAGFGVLGLDVQSIGHEHIPTTGAAILASNHIGYLDFAFVALAPPRPRRQVLFLVRHDLFERRVAGALLRRLGQIPVDVHGAPGAALAPARDRLLAGDVIGIHPEGTISPSFVPRRGRSGVVRLAWDTGAPVVPVAVWGSQRLLTKDRPARLTRGVPVVVRYGEAYTPEAGGPAAQRTSELMGRIRTLLEVTWEQYPDRPAGPSDDWWVPAHLGGSAPSPEQAERRVRDQAEERRRRRRSPE